MLPSRRCLIAAETRFLVSGVQKFTSADSTRLLGFIWTAHSRRAFRSSSSSCTKESSSRNWVLLSAPYSPSLLSNRWSHLQKRANFTSSRTSPSSARFHRPRLSPSYASTLNLARHVSSRPPTHSPPPPAKPPPNPVTKPLATLQSLTPHENIYTIPNILTFTRLLSAPAVGYLILSPTHPHIYALALFTYASLTDLLDGYLARRFNSFTVVGSVIDPMADKLLMTICTFSLAYTGILPIYTATIIIGRDVALAISAIWWRWISLPPPKTMRRYWDFSLPSAEVRPTEISKINTLLQLCLIGNAMVLPVLPEAVVEAWNLWGVFEGWCGLVSATTVWSGLSYVGNKDAVKIVSQEEVRKVLEEREAAKEEGVGSEGKR